MRKRANPKAKVVEEEDEERFGTDSEEKGEEGYWKSFIKSVNTDNECTDDDDEANEDLSLKIIQKSLQMRSKQFNSREAANLLLANGADGRGTVCFSGGSSITEVGAVEKAKGKALVDELVVPETDNSGRKRKRRKKSKKVEVAEEQIEMVEEDKTNEAGESETTEKVDSADSKNENVIDNIVLKKLLRGPRYFDPPDSGGWGTCFNCGEEGHSAVNCTSARRKKPCFVCGSLDHNAKQCQKGRDCFICNKGGHRAKDCPEKGKSGFGIPRICLRCGDHGHDMFSCKNDYVPEDLKDIQCYVCKNFGHLCCSNTVDIGPKQLSCYKCGLLGHIGLACSRVRGEAAEESSLALCYRCGEEGHFARVCTSSSKVARWRHEPSTPTTLTWEFHSEGKYEKTLSRSAPNDIGKPMKKKKTVSEKNGLSTPRKPKQRGGWITEHPGDYSPVKPKRNKWKSHASPSRNGTGWTDTRRFTDYQSPDDLKFHSRSQPQYESTSGFHYGYEPQGKADGCYRRKFEERRSSVGYHNRNSARWSSHGDYLSNNTPNYRFPATRFDHGNNGTRSNYSWW